MNTENALLPSERASLLAELTTLYEISYLGNAASLEQLGQDALEKALRLFGVRRFGLWDGATSHSSFISCSGLRDQNPASLKSKKSDNSFCKALGCNGDSGFLYMEKPTAIASSERRMYEIFARRVEISLWRLNEEQERHRTLESLARNEAKYRSLFERSMDAVCLVATDGTLLEANPAFLKLYGIDPSDVGHFNVVDLYEDPRERDALVSALEQDGALLDLDIRFTRQDGASIECQRSSVGITDEDGGLIAIQSVIRDVTATKKSERELRESELRFRSLVENTGAGILIAGEDRNAILDCNRAAVQLLGHTRESLLRTPAIKLVSHARDLREMLRQMDENGSVRDHELELKRPDGLPLFVEFNATTVQQDGLPVIIAELRDITERKKAVLEVQEKNRQLERALQGTVEVIQQMVETRDPYTAGHQRRVADLAVAIARRMHLPEQTCVDPIRTAALVHDIGKMNVPAEILSKPGTLTDVEFGLIKSHSQVGYDILSRTQLPEPVAEVVLQHHERLDGSGYPRGLTGDDILPEAQVLSVADVVEAMSSHRPYRPALGLQEALEEVTRWSGIRYDADVVDACVAVFREDGFSFSR